jgi:hypothetical protein
LAVSDRERFPDPDPVVARLREGPTDAEDVLALVGFVGPGRMPPGEDEGAPPDDERRSLRMHADTDLQRWLEIPRDAVVHSQQVEPGEDLTRSIVWVKRPEMNEPILSDDQADALDRALDPAPLSGWNLIPETRLVAASMLGLLPYEEGWDEKGGDS